MARNAGFTLVELILVLTICSILVAAAGPSFSQLVSNTRMTSGINSLVYSLNMARSEAVKRASRVVACKTQGSESCTNTGKWSDGWLVFVDTNNNALHDSGEPRLQVRQALKGDISLRGNLMVRNYIGYGPDGMARTSGGAFQMGTIVTCDRRGLDSGKAIVINSAGRIRTVRAVKTSFSSC